MQNEKWQKRYHMGSANTLTHLEGGSWEWSADVADGPMAVEEREAMRAT